MRGFHSALWSRQDLLRACSSSLSTAGERLFISRLGDFQEKCRSEHSPADISKISLLVCGAKVPVGSAAVLFNLIFNFFFAVSLRFSRLQGLPFTKYFQLFYFVFLKAEVKCLSYFVINMTVSVFRWTY